MISSRLPVYFQRPPFLNIAQYISQSQVAFSSLLCQHQGKLHLFKKDNESHVPLDWQVYTMLRASVNLKLTTGANLRAQPDMYRVHQGYGDPHTEELYEALRPKLRQKIIVFSRQLTNEQLDDYVNPKYYQRLEMPKFERFADCVNQLKQKHCPILVEFGLVLLKQMIAQIKEGSSNPIDTMLLSIYRGVIPPQYLGDQFEFPLEQHYELKWKSQEYPCSMHTGQEGGLTFLLYQKRKL